MSVHLKKRAVAVGKTILQTDLRLKSGASIVALKRDGTSLVNPPPSTTLAVGDELLVLGGPDQLEAARKLLE